MYLDGPLRTYTHLCANPQTRTDLYAPMRKPANPYGPIRTYAQTRKPVRTYTHLCANPQTRTDLYAPMRKPANPYGPIRTYAQTRKPVRTYTHLCANPQTRTDLYAPMRKPANPYGPIRTYAQTRKPVRTYTHLYVPICGVKIRWSVCIVLYCIVFHCSNFVSQEVGALGGWDRCAGFSANFFQLFLLTPHSLDLIKFYWI